MFNAFQYSMYYYPDYVYYNPYLFNYISYNDAIALRKITGVTLGGYYPLSRFIRTQFSLTYSHYEEDFYDPYLATTYSQRSGFGTSYGYFWNGGRLAANFSLIGETTRFTYYGPSSGNTFRISLSQSIPLFKSLQNTSVDIDLRQYLNLGSDFLFAVRFVGFLSRGENPYVTYYGGNNQVRSSYFYNIIGTEGWYANLEFRFPLVSVANTILGQIGPVRGTLFVDLTRAKLKGYPAKFYDYLVKDNIVYLDPYDARGSIGYGIEFFLFGLPLHVEFVKRLKIVDMNNPFDLTVDDNFTTKFWIGFDF
jgi:hypothetical protein